MLLLFSCLIVHIYLKLEAKLSQNESLKGPTVHSIGKHNKPIDYDEQKLHQDFISSSTESGSGFVSSTIFEAMHLKIVSFNVVSSVRYWNGS